MRLTVAAPGLALLGTLVVATALGGCGSSGSPTTAATAPSHAPRPANARAHPAKGSPNIVVVMSDDQDTASVAQAMPRTERLARSGTTFTDNVVTTPSCCPSRASFITGEYGHNNGVLSNIPGYPELRDNANVLPVWLQRAGYRTAEFGKFMNEYESPATKGGLLPAPGWDSWNAFLPPFTYFDYSIATNGRSKHYGARNRDYLTDVLTGRAVRYIEAKRPPNQRFFAWVNIYAPHLVDTPEARAGRCAGSAIPAPRDRRRFTVGNVPTPRSFGEPNVSDKPFYVRARPAVDAKRAAKYKQAHACRLGSLVDVDRSVQRIYDALRRTGQLQDTILVFTSDNGWLEGEHRIEGKAVPYDEAIGVPLIVWAPSSVLGGASEPRRVSEPVANIDLAPTLLQSAGASACAAPGHCRVIDGRSLLPLLRGDRKAWPPDRPILLESREGDFGLCRFEGVRTKRYVYIKNSPFASGNSGPCAPVTDRELYDLRADPLELRNLYPAPKGSNAAKEERLLRADLHRLRNCRGHKGPAPCR